MIKRDHVSSISELLCVASCSAALCDDTSSGLLQICRVTGDSEKHECEQKCGRGFWHIRARQNTVWVQSWLVLPEKTGHAQSQSIRCWESESAGSATLPIAELASARRRRKVVLCSRPALSFFSGRKVSRKIRTSSWSVPEMIHRRALMRRRSF